MCMRRILENSFVVKSHVCTNTKPVATGSQLAGHPIFYFLIGVAIVNHDHNNIISVIITICDDGNTNDSNLLIILVRAIVTVMMITIFLNSCNNNYSY